jgi:outer membrane immunogenic protein
MITMSTKDALLQLFGHVFRLQLERLKVIEILFADWFAPVTAVRRIHPVRESKIMLRTSIAAGLTLVAGATASFAADLPRRNAPLAPAPYYAPVPVYSWTGFYAGVTAGAAFRSAPASSVNYAGFTAPEPGTAYQGSVSGSSTSFTGGFHAGYNWQFQNHLVFGLEGDIDYVGRRSTRAAVLPAVPGTNYFAYTPVSGGSNWIGTVRPRLGYAADRALLYVTGGMAFGSTPGGGSVTYVSTVAGPPAVTSAYLYGSNTSSKTKIGWAAGIGGEYAITPNLIARVEYLYTSLGKTNLSYLAPAGAPAGSVFRASYSNNIGLLRGGVSYKF